MQYKKVIILIILILCISPVHAQKKSKKIKIILGNENAIVIGGIQMTTGQAIKIAVENNKDILSQSYNVAMTDTDYKSFLSKYLLQVNGELGYKQQKYPQSMQFMYGKENTTVDGSIGLSKMFSSGTGVGLGLNHSYSKLKRDTSQFGDIFGPNESHTPVLYVSLQQELLKNFLGYQDRRQKKILKNVAKMQREVTIYQLSNIVLSVIRDYWTVILNKISVENAELQLIETRNVRNITARNVRLGLADNFNLNYYNSLVASAESSLTKSRYDFKTSLRNFLTVISQKPDLKVTGSVVFSIKMPILKKEAALKAAYSKRADYLMAKLTLKNAKLDYQLQKNGDMPSLTASLNYNAMGVREKMGDAYGDSAGNKYPTIEARLKMSYPLGDTQQYIKIRNAKYNLKKARIELEKIKRQINDEVINSIEQITASYKLYKKSKEARIQSAIFYWRMLASMRRGRLTAATVKNGVDALIQSRIAEMQALVNFNLAKIQYLVVRNELFEHYKINPNDYIPKEK